MRKLLFIALMAMFTGCAPKPEKVAQVLIKDYLHKNLDDPSTYEAVEFGELDSIIYPWSKYAATLQERVDFLSKEIQECEESILRYQAMSIDMSQFIVRYQDLINKNNTEIEKTKNDLSKQDEWQEHKGFEMAHSFRATNAFGAKILNKYKFTINCDLTAIEDVEILTE